MTEETQGAVETDATDTLAVLAHASGDKTYVSQPKGDESKDKETPPGDDAAAKDETTKAEPEGDKPKDAPKKQTVQERIDELTRARREAERRADDAERRLASAKPAEPAKAASEEDPEPDPSQFQYGDLDPAYVKALGAHAARQEFARLSQASAKTVAETEHKARAGAVEQAWTERQAEFAKDKADYFDLTGAKDLAITPVMADALKEAEAGPAVAYHLAQNPDEARRIAALSEIAQVRELTRIELSLSAAPAAPQAKTATDAPEPAPTVRGAGGRFKVAADTDDFAAFEAQYLKGS